MRVLLFWLILITSKARVEKIEVQGTVGSLPENEDFVKKREVVPIEIDELLNQNDTLKRRFHNDDVRSTKTKRSTQSGISNDTFLADSFIVPCVKPSRYSCLGRCSREWDLGPTVGRLQCFCDSFCETFMDCCSDYDKYCSPSKFFSTEDTLPKNSSRGITPTETTALVQQSTKLSLTHTPALFESVAPSSSYKPSQPASKATLSSGFSMEPLRNAPDERWKCIQDGHGNETVGIWMIATCPQQWPADLTRQQCEQAYSLSAETYNDMIPVSDQRGTNYKNRHCAKCAQVKASEIMPFELDVTGSVTPPQHFSRVEALRFLFKYCLKIQWKARDGKHRRYCKTIYSSCLTTSPYFQNCKNGSFRIVYDTATRKNYKNLFCAKCHKHKASTFICGPRNRLTRNPRLPRPKYNVLLDVLNTKKILVTVSCPVGTVYDIHLEICRKTAMRVPNIAGFDKYRVILWLTSTRWIRIRKDDIVTSLAATFNLEVAKISVLSLMKAGDTFTVRLDLELERNQTNLETKTILEFTKEVTIKIRNVSFTIFKSTSRLINCVQVQQFSPSQYTIIVHNNVSEVFLKATKEIFQHKDYYAEKTEVKEGALIPKGNITICGKRLVRNCSGTYISLNKTEYVILSNGSLFRNASNKLYSAENYYITSVDNSVWICTSFVRIYRKVEEERNDLRFLAPLCIAGLSISITFLLIVLVTYFTFSELRTIPGIHLVNLSFSLLLSHLVWLLATVLETPKPSCTALAVFLHYFFLVSFAWMSIIAYDTWRAFSCKYWHQSRGIWREMRARVMRHMAVGWLPALIFVVICTALDQSNVANIGYGGNTGCWISNRVANLCVFTTPVALSTAFNIVYFLRTIKAIRQTKRQTRNLTEQSQKRRDFPIFARIAALMGFSWLFGFLAMLISKYLWYPFTVLTTLQGVYIATAFVFAAPRVRKLYYNLFTEKLGRNIVHSAGVGPLRSPPNYLLATSAFENHSDLDYNRTRISEAQL